MRSFAAGVATTTSLLVRSSAMSVVTVAGPVEPAGVAAPGPPGGPPGGWGTPGPGVGVTVSPGRAPGRLALASKSFWMVVARSLAFAYLTWMTLSLIHISEPTRLLSISYAVFCLK